MEPLKIERGPQCIVKCKLILENSVDITMPFNERKNICIGKKPK